MARRIGELSEAVEAGYRVGRARRRTTADDCYRFASRRLQGAFWRGYKRGLRAGALLDQMSLELSRGDG